MAALTVDGRAIDGELACPPVSTELDEQDRKRDRWVTFELYHLDTGGWLAHRTGYSSVYHRLDTRCTTRIGRQSGDPATISQLPDDAVPCLVCKPPYPDRLPETDEPVVRFEFPRHTWDECPTPALVKEKLTTIRSRDGTTSTVTSDPVGELLRGAARSYPEFIPLVTPAA
jgi:hypothetical protein